MVAGWWQRISRSCALLACTFICSCHLHTVAVHCLPHHISPPTGNMGTWYDTSSLVTSVRNFPNERGVVVGVLKSYLGLSSSIYTSVYAW